MEFIEVKKKENKKYSGNVYDIKVHGEDHTFKVNGFTVHNSAGGSLVACATGITKWSVDPIKNGLLFERFISSERLPDSIIDYYCSDE
jgi:hypothetical protein